ncbi:nucleoside triphosphate pyrophosphohydrolase [Bacillus sp. RG28]|uniref:Nucleoside triphosphate pyrophosphohydrolase n=1 Tax=Gottfriedia endophytica TaxID=2820819 RepID=A0A940NV09_9BACI|nr:nucleoside triphosphate pyrophosphohydrolase [Gottfriedia endophytica]MBP0727256.1 nucleoside triphosphate pyrophosphohydrolase [Gottfriedia endophytica]
MAVIKGVFALKYITVIGLGASDLEQMPIGIYRALLSSDNLFLRTKDHPVVSELEKEGLQYTALDDIYEKHDAFEAVYEEIVQVICQEAEKKPVMYAVPGHPLVAERTVQLLIELEKQKEIELNIVGGQSFLDAMFASLKIDPIEGFQLVDATSIDNEILTLKQHLIICQVYDQMTASIAKLTLMEQLPDDYEVTVVTAAGSANEKIQQVPLYELDRVATINNLTSVYVPPVKNEEQTYHQFTTLRKIVETLRGPNGCPWDQKQTNASLKKYLLEEAYELLEAIDEEDDEHIIEELGDVLLQVMLHAQIGEDDGYFSIDDVIRGLSKKLIFRHPHVFGDVQVEGEQEVLSNWQALKEQEKGKERDSILSGIPKDLSGLMKAEMLQRKAAKVGFDWPELPPVLDKIKEEFHEVLEAIETKDESGIEAELGDLLFSIVNLTRFVNVDPEQAILKTNKKFETRFKFIENRLNELQKSFQDVTLEEMDAIWNEAKKVK